MELPPKDTTIFVLKDGLEIFGQPDKQSRVKVRRIADKARTWHETWRKYWVIGQTTGEISKGIDGDYLQVLVVQSDWLRRNILTGILGKIAGYLKGDSVGYIPLPGIDGVVYYFAKDGKPINFGTTILGSSGTGTTQNTPVPDGATPGTTGNGTGTGTGSSNTILWVVVAVLALVAGFVGFRKLSKPKK
jgi:hypothetical protein